MKNNYLQTDNSLDGWWSYEQENSSVDKIFLSKALENFYLHNKVSKINQLQDLLRLVHSEDKSILKNLLQNLIHKDDTSWAPKIEYRVISLQSKVYWVLAKFELKKIKNKETRVNVTQTDITLLKNNELQLMRSNKELEEFAYIISHDLQTPIRQIDTYSEIIETYLQKGKAEEIPGFLKKISKTIRHMKGLTQDLLELCKIGQAQLDFEKLSILEVIEHAQAILMEEVQLSQAQVSIQGSFPKLIIANKQYLTDVFVNLISNSIKYSREDISPKIEIKYKEENQKHLFSIKDNGLGIPKSSKDKIFQIFKRSHTEKKQIKGSGIGLAIVKKIIEIHQGSIELSTPQPEVGALFQIVLPKKISDTD